MLGAAGNDGYVVDSAGDVVTENPGEGTDGVLTTLSAYTLGANIEHLGFTGTGNFAATGNALGNAMSGGSGNDVLTGLDGNDFLFGFGGDDGFVATIGDGNDGYFGGDGSDTVDFSQLTAAVTVDLASGSASGTQIGRDNLNAIENVIGGAGGDTINGDNLANVLRGGAGNDTLSGRAGADTLEGGAGDDNMDGGLGADTFLFQSGFGSDLVQGFDANPNNGQDRLDITALGITKDDFSKRVAITDIGSATLVTIDGASDQTIRLAGIGNSTTVTIDDFLLA
jgi:Ca2+-binding RTX toxin-like protein